ncbi:hypothetical protein [Mycolicibacterium mageritense]|uniref:hypothetical protein n=1 Tax=Mycolicibacterium mageritense TaxID=53462 RepID=UPI0011D952D9|nr:hypothetical protein [Mycolicibacterium mageritense]TXI56463.1 MAG: hypothetical protein E6Q55_28775 [Mycolicibacterium mageritense]
MVVPWSELEADQAETLLAVLLYNEHPRAVRVRPSRGDWGIDVLNPHDSAPDTFDVYQIKYFSRSLTAGQKGQVEKSFRRMLLGLARREIPAADWYLLIPVDPTIDNQMDWFRAMPETVIAQMFDDTRFVKLEKKQPPLTDEEKAAITAWRSAPGRIIQWQGRSACVTLAAKHPHVVDYYLGGGREHLDKTIADLTSILRGPGSAPAVPGQLPAPSDMRTHLAALQSVLDTDPHFRYAFSVDPPRHDVFVVDELNQQGFSLDRSAPGLVAEPGLVAATQEPLSDGWTLTFRIYQRFAESLAERPVPVRLTFASTAASFDRQAYDLWRKYGTPFTAPAIVHADLPGGLGSNVSGEIGEVSLHAAGVAYDARLRIRTPAGATGPELAFPMTVTTGPDGTGTREYGTDTTGFLTFEILTDNETHQGAWNIGRRPIAGAEVVAALPSIEFLQDLRAPNTLQVARKLGPFIDHQEIPEERPARFPDVVMEYLRALAIIQQHTPTPILVPDLTTLTQRDVDVVLEASALVTDRAVLSTWGAVRMAGDASLKKDDAEQEIDVNVEYQLLFVERLVVPVGDQKLTLGTVAGFALSARYFVEDDTVVARPYRNDTLQKTYSPDPGPAGPAPGRVLGRTVGPIKAEA